MTDLGPVDLREGEGDGPLWGTASQELNVTLLAWQAGHGVDDHVNAERDVLIVVIEGSAIVTVDERPYRLDAPSALVVPLGATRSITAGDAGVRYVSAHRRRQGLGIRRRP